jgi:hypothetical protein
VTVDIKDVDYSSGDVCGVLVQYPGFRVQRAKWKVVHVFV